VESLALVVLLDELASAQRSLAAVARRCESVASSDEEVSATLHLLAVKLEALSELTKPE